MVHAAGYCGMSVPTLGPRPEGALPRRIRACTIRDASRRLAVMDGGNQVRGSTRGRRSSTRRKARRKSKTWGCMARSLGNADGFASIAWRVASPETQAGSARTPGGNGSCAPERSAYVIRQCLPWLRKRGRCLCRAHPIDAFEHP